MKETFRGCSSLEKIELDEERSNYLVKKNKEKHVKEKPKKD